MGRILSKDANKGCFALRLHPMSTWQVYWPRKALPQNDPNHYYTIVYNRQVKDRMRLGNQKHQQVDFSTSIIIDMRYNYNRHMQRAQPIRWNRMEYEESEGSRNSRSQSSGLFGGPWSSISCVRSYGVRDVYRACAEFLYLCRTCHTYWLGCRY